MLAVVSKLASRIQTVGKPRSNRKQVSWLVPMQELLTYVLPGEDNRMSKGLAVY